MMLTSIFYFFFANFEKKSAYECGFSALKDTRSNFEISYYLVAILFLVFDLEVLFLLPFVLVFNQVTNLIFYIVLIFVYFLVLGIVYEWRKGALDWAIMKLSNRIVMLNYLFNFLSHSKIIKQIKLTKVGLVIILINKLKFLVFFNLLKYHFFFQFMQLLDIFIVDFPNKKARFELNYVVVSLKFNQRFIIKFSICENQFVPSLTTFFQSANWLERESWDMFGIFFINHPDLRRILTDYGFTGFPLRKDFPLSGYDEIRYDFNKKKIIFEKLELNQEFRFFKLMNPWVYSIKENK